MALRSRGTQTKYSWRKDLRRSIHARNKVIDYTWKTYWAARRILRRHKPPGSTRRSEGGTVVASDFASSCILVAIHILRRHRPRITAVCDRYRLSICYDDSHCHSPSIHLVPTVPLIVTIPNHSLLRYVVPPILPPFVYQLCVYAPLSPTLSTTS